jgi:antitoxin component of MazEF toxin-antitoxin module
MREGTQVDLECKGDVLVLRPKSRPRHRLSQLLRGCSAAKLHREGDFGPDLGAEVID